MRIKIITYIGPTHVHVWFDAVHFRNIRDKYTAVFLLRLINYKNLTAKLIEKFTC